MRKGGKTKVAILSLIILAILTISIFAITIGANTHTSSAELQPEWSTPGVTNDYTVTITNQGPDTVDEVRIYRNMQYSEFVCKEKEGWELQFITAKQACHYIAKDSDHYIEEEQSAKFEFSAKAPTEDPKQCLLYWKFETRDVNEMWKTIYDTTSIDSQAPETTKTYGDPHYPANINEPSAYPHYISTSTPITLTATDMSLDCGIGVDKTYWRNILVPDQYCWTEYSGCQNYQVPPETPWREYTGPFTKPEESCHLIEYYSVDKLGNKEEINRQCVFVDDTPPVLSKEIGKPNYGRCEQEMVVEECEDWTGCGVIEKKKDFMTTGRYGDGNPTAGAWELAIGVPNTDTPENTKDQENFDWDSGVEKDFSVSYNPSNGNIVYVVGDKTLTWTYNTGKAFGYLVVFSKGNANGNSVQLTNMVLNGKSLPNVNSGAAYKGVKVLLPDSAQANGFVLTGKAKLVWGGNPQNEIPAFHIFAMETHDYNPEDCWLRDHVTPITLTCRDQEPHPVNKVSIYYRILLDGELLNDWAEYTEPIIFQEDSEHTLEYYCEDAVENSDGTREEPHVQFYRVDSLPPIIYKEMIGEEHLGDCPPTKEGDVCYVADNGQNGVLISVADDNTFEGCAVGNVQCNYELWWMGQKIAEDEFNEQARIIFTQDSTHTLKIWCQDVLGNEVYDEEEFLVDSTPPKTTKTLGPEGTFYIDEQTGAEWIDTATLITLGATDEKVGVDKIYYKINGPVENRYCESREGCSYWEPSHQGEGWTEYTNPFNGMDESCHVVEYYSVDKLGNKENVQWQCMFVDKTAPVAYLKDVGEPNIKIGDDEYWVQDHVTEIELGCRIGPNEPHPSPLSNVQFRYNIDGGEFTPWTDYTNPIIFNEDSVHVLEYKCKDVVGKESSTQTKTFRVDSTPPETTKTYIPDAYVDPQTGAEYIDTVNEIELTAVDGGEICAVGLDKIFYRITQMNDNACSNPETYCIPSQDYKNNWITYEEKFKINDESCHMIEYYAVDKLGNKETIKAQCVFVDKKAPIIEKRYEGAYFKENEIEWISSQTDVVIGVKDSEPHPSGVKDVEYRVSLVPDNYCNDKQLCQQGITTDKEYDKASPLLFNQETGYLEYKFKITEESCHLIEIKAVDNVGKTSEHKQCVFVDNTPPTPVKEVLEPKTKWDGKDSVFYKEETANCWSTNSETSIDCWRVTLDTPISMTCEDPAPHPVDNEKICFNVEVDGDDRTGGENGYCGVYGGQMNDEGFCCLDKTIENFVFLETTEHNLKFYCVDALGNTNQEIDEEKFKVEGNDFVIKINKKWNLISVPVVLLDDNIKTIIPDSMGDIIESVWTYDKAIDTWYVYTPDGIDNDNLDKLTPGWGYWVLAKDATEIVIGGSLLSPGRSPPSRNLVPGWNLVGYYGIKDENGENVEGYYGPDLTEDGQQTVCACGTLCGPFWFEKWGSVVTYWQLDSDPWIYLGRYDYMNPGAGYWLYMREAGEYSKATSCCSFLGP